MKITAEDITRLLKERHKSNLWVSVPECKIGSSWNMKNCQRFDFWTMAKSYSKPRYIGYEIKVSRQDFLNDFKFQGYLNYCREFYFVSPPGIIFKDEIPPECGLMYCSKNAKMLITKKKAPVRNIEIPMSIIDYILISRVAIREEHKTNSLEYWKKYVSEKEESKRVGTIAKQKIATKIKTRCGDILQENLKLKNENLRLQSVKDFMDSAGIEDTQSVFRIKGEIQKALTGLTRYDVRILFDLSEKLKDVVSVLEKIERI